MCPCQAAPRQNRRHWCAVPTRALRSARPVGDFRLRHEHCGQYGVSCRCRGSCSHKSGAANRGRCAFPCSVQPTERRNCAVWQLRLAFLCGNCRSKKRLKRPPKAPSESAATDCAHHCPTSKPTHSRQLTTTASQSESSERVCFGRGRADWESHIRQLAVQVANAEDDQCIPP